MDRMLVVVFKNQSSAYKGKEALLGIADNGDIAVYAYAILTKNPDGSSSVKQEDDGGPLGTLLGTSLGSLIGLLAGPVGVVVGATAGMLGGMADDLDNSRIGSGFLQDVNAKLTPGTVALVAEINEDWTEPVDTQMEALGGEVFRRALNAVEQQVDDEDVAAMKSDLEHLKAEHARAQAERKQKLQSKIDALQAKLHAAEAKAKQKREQREAIIRAKAAVLQSKVAALNARV
ncbi:MAG: DUF1269 domain-containing protein [Edaphobacter sp.]